MIDQTQSDGPQRRGRAGVVAPDAASAAQAAFARAGFPDARLVLDWAAIAGTETAKVCLPVRLSGGVLTLKAEPGAAVFLHYETRSLCERINAYLGRSQVQRLKFVQGPLPARPPLPARRVPAENVAADDPVRKYDGPEGVRTALVKLARARRMGPIMP